MELSYKWIPAGSAGGTRPEMPIGLLALPTISSADVLYSNIGMAYPTDPADAYAAGFDYFATILTVGVTGPLSCLEIDVAGFNGDASDFFGAALYTDSSAEPGATCRELRRQAGQRRIDDANRQGAMRVTTDEPLF
jgi:hypothetical protein